MLLKMVLFCDRAESDKRRRPGMLCRQPAITAGIYRPLTMTVKSSRSAKW
jgi:hypothetical protein